MRPLSLLSISLAQIEFEFAWDDLYSMLRDGLPSIPLDPHLRDDFNEKGKREK